MGYMHINNLYRDTNILMFKECYAMEKIHGTSAHISWKDGKVSFFAGGEKHANFIKLFDEEKLTEKFTELFDCDVFVFGEAYGGKCQGMSETYGKELKFVSFDVKVDNNWLDVQSAEDVVNKLELEFVDYVKIYTDLESINVEKERPSIQAVRNGMGDEKMREGVVLRPIIELKKNNGNRIMCKHKRDEFMETKTKREVDPEKLKILQEANEISEEWVTPMRLSHVLDKMGNPNEIEDTGKVIKAMIEDVFREAEGEIVESQQAKAAIGKKCANLYKARINKLTKIQ